MDIVTALGVIKCLRIVAHRVEAASLIRLLQDGSRGVLGGIDFEGVRTVGVGLLEDGITQDNLLESLYGFGASRGPIEGHILLREFGQRFGNVGKASDKRSLVAEHPKGASDLFHSAKLFGPSGQAVTFRGVDTDGAVADYYAQVLNCGVFEFTLGGFEEETLSLQKVEDVMDNAAMEGQIVVCSDENVIHINKQHSWVLVFQGAEQAVHGFLERGWRVRQSEVHDVWLVQPKGCLERCFVVVLWLDLDVIITPSDVKCGEERLAL
jgi:hypothetical protein